MKIDAIFFDWGGVIADDPGDDFLVNLLREVGASESQVEAIYASSLRNLMRGEISENDFWQLLRDDYKLDVATDIAGRFTSWQGLEANKEILALVDKAKAQGIKTGLITNTLAPTFAVLQKSGLLNRFDSIIASCEVGIIKPDLKIYQLALDQLHVRADTSLFIDDKQKNLDAAEQLGLKTILATTPKQIISDVSAYIV